MNFLASSIDKSAVAIDYPGSDIFTISLCCFGSEPAVAELLGRSASQDGGRKDDETKKFPRVTHVTLRDSDELS